LRRAIENHEIDAFIAFMLDICELAIELGSKMVETMV